MPEGHYRYCDVSLPVPVDQVFTYELPETLRHRVKRGCRLMVPFGPRKLTGVIVATHNNTPDAAARQALMLLDEEPALDAELLALGRWIANYYCAPLGEVYRSMTPLSSEIRKGKMYTLTDTGRDVARQLLIGDSNEDPVMAVLRLLENRPLSATYLKKKVPDADKAIKSLLRRSFIEAEDIAAERDPLRSPSPKLLVQFTHRVDNEKLRKAERELLSYLELHPGEHNLAEVEQKVNNSGAAARSLARRGLLSMKPVNAVSFQQEHRPPHLLNSFQQSALDTIAASIQSRQFRTHLLRGVTGSGKTEVYLRAIDVALELGLGTLMLVPEIALTPAVSGQFFNRFGDRVAILHSAFSGGERAEQWRAIRAGKAMVVVGTRSCVFAPVRNLGLIIVDEEHDQSYKQEETPRYNGRDVAIVRAQAAGASVVLGSATPSLETGYNASRGKYQFLELPARVAGRPMPEVEIVDMRQEFLESRKQATFSRRLIEAIHTRIEANEQVIVLLNRRGFSSFAACRSCGERLECRNCAVTLTYHHRDRRMLCHYCDYAEKVPKTCPKCDSDHMYFLGTGSEKVEDELHLAFPRARIARMDRDTITGKRGFETILHGFRAHEYDILVGTQMIAKGHDIPNVTLVGVVSADVGLGMPDFRAAERTFQLLTQVAGRAGRGDLPGTVIVQTINPDHYAIRFAAAQDYSQFYEKELQFRRMMRYPPFSALANIMVRHASQQDALAMANQIGDFFGPSPADVRVLGPAEAPIPRLKAEFRYQLLIKAAGRKRLNELLHNLRAFAGQKRWPSTSLVIDVDPLSLL
ncbi:MAG: primosomal protein N' [Bryobacteraceae bacterium]|nr:primosomal protein N' [Bryobacteraceae bacterium]